MANLEWNVAATKDVHNGSTAAGLLDRASVPSGASKLAYSRAGAARADALAGARRERLVSFALRIGRETVETQSGNIAFDVAEQ